MRAQENIFLPKFKCSARTDLGYPDMGTHFFDLAPFEQRQQDYEECLTVTNCFAQAYQEVYYLHIN